MPSFTQPFQLTAGGPAVGPPANSSFINIDFTNLTGRTLPASLFGVAISSQSGFTSTGITDQQVINTFKSLIGSIPGTYLRWNLENGGQNGDGSANNGFVDNVTNFTRQLIDVTTGTFSYNVGNTGASSGQNGAGAGQVYDRFVSNGLPCLQYEVFNETQDVMSDSTYNANFVAISQVLHQRNPNCIVIGNNYSFQNSGAFSSLVSAAGSGLSRMDRAHWHNYQAGPNQGSWPMGQATGTFGGRDVPQCRGAIGGTIPQGCGEYNMDGNPGGQPLQYQLTGAVYNNLAMFSSVTADPKFTHGALWQAFADDGYGQIVDHVMASNTGLAYLSMVPCGHVFSNCRKYLPGNIVSSSGPGGNLALMATVNGSNFGIWLINYDQFATFTGQLALSHWPVNSTGNGNIQRLEISPSHLSTFTSPIGVTAGLTQSITLPAQSVTVLTATL